MAGLGFLNYRVPTPPRMQVSDLDKCAIVSIYPREIRERNHTLEPGTWVIPAGTYQSPSVTVIGPSSWWLQPDPEKQAVEILVPSILVAKSVVDDWARSLVEYKEGEAMPGLFIIPGNLTVEQVKKDHKSSLDAALARQRQWYANLVSLADNLWSRSNGNPRVIGDDTKFAAQELGLKDKPWLRDFSTIEKTPCIGCGSLLNPAYPVCPVCRVINNQEAASKLNLKFA